MRKVVVTLFVTLDGIAAEPQEWSFPYWNDGIQNFKEKELFASDAQLLGRVTYEGFAAAWPNREGKFAEHLNSTPKYVVSTTLDRAEWNNSTVIRNNVAEEVRKLKEQPGKDILVHGSLTLMQTLMEHGLVDDYNLLVFPLVRGGGKRMFKDGSTATLTLVEAKSYDTGVVLLRYQPAK